MDQPGFLGTGASLSSDLTLLIYILLLVPLMLVGFVFARRRMFIPHHKMVMTVITLMNWVLIILVMLLSYREGVAPYLPENISDARVLLPTIHLVTGGAAQLLATYLVFRMWFENVLPQWVMVKNIKVYMRATLTLWIITAALGALIYVIWYVPPAGAAANPGSTSPIVTPEAAPLATEETVLAPAATLEAAPQEDFEDDDSGQGRGRGRGRGGDDETDDD
jgi:uncharacterized membrane protein YozB (DUF420 family)